MSTTPGSRWWVVLSSSPIQELKHFGDSDEDKGDPTFAQQKKTFNIHIMSTWNFINTPSSSQSSPLTANDNRPMAKKPMASTWCVYGKEATEKMTLFIGSNLDEMLREVRGVERRLNATIDEIQRLVVLKQNTISSTAHSPNRYWHQNIFWWMKTQNQITSFPVPFPE